MQRLYIFTHMSCSRFFSTRQWCLARIPLQGFSSAQLNPEAPSTEFAPVQKVEHSYAHTLGCPRLSLTTATGLSKLSEFKLLSQALPILAMWLHCLAGLQGSRTGP